MPRNTVQKIKTTTTAHGFVIVDGNPQPIRFQLDHKCTEQQAQRIIRKSQPSFSVSSCTYVDTLYTMTFDQFYAAATPTEVKEY